MDYNNRTDKDHETIVWAPVIGYKEKFDFLELLSFPVYVLNNHGDTWNAVTEDSEPLRYSYWLLLALGAPTLLFIVRKLVEWGGSAFLLTPYTPSREVLTWVLRLTLLGPVFEGFKVKSVSRKVARACLYELSLIGFVAVALEQFTHLIYVYIDIEPEFPTSSFWAGLAVIIFSNGFPILIVCLIWTALKKDEEKDWMVLAHPGWAVLEVLSGLSFFFLFGSGFYLGPGALTLAGVTRCVDLYKWWASKSTESEDRPVLYRGNPVYQQGTLIF